MTVAEYIARTERIPLNEAQAKVKAMDQVTYRKYFEMASRLECQERGIDYASVVRAAHGG